MSALSRFAGTLPVPEQLRERLRALTVLESCFDLKWPRYRFTPDDGSGFEHFRFENGGGDRYHVFLGGSVAFLRAFDHTSQLSPYVHDAVWPGLLDGLPESLEPLTRLQGDERKYPLLTLALWHDGTSWRHGTPRPREGREAELTTWMLGPLLTFTPAAVVEHLSNFYGRPVDAEAVGAMLRGEPVDRELVERIAPGADVERVAEIARTVGGRTASPTADR
ncbi:hypothetical protein PV749_09485 [Streptomyces sp. ID03-2B]|uniref:hypothetical protein n=1 Tax=unclassified Streptomyces TaxID=2593676 RepID=UPI0019CB976B|nr:MULTISPECIES: hypothetical protein [unclassified Streptomyces]MDX2669959.1 hypothetical protein [Streptomyces sp. NRRL_ISP-5395]MDX3591357.1 hypothetical protein [Streptomyces sp. ID03-2B]GHF80410.1 hypothetical protein GCM10010504_56430 [Streptomyces griseus]